MTKTSPKLRSKILKFSLFQRINCIEISSDVVQQLRKLADENGLNVPEESKDNTEIMYFQEGIEDLQKESDEESSTENHKQLLRELGSEDFASIRISKNYKKKDFYEN